MGAKAFNIDPGLKAVALHDMSIDTSLIQGFVQFAGRIVLGADPLIPALQR
jgi:hypothetical protein